MNQGMKEHILYAIKKGYRFDGRKPEEWRDITIETNTSKSAEGSAEVKFGNSHVIVGVKFSVGTPFPDSPNKGVLMVGAELHPLSHPKFEGGPPGIDAIEIARVIDRGIRESKMIDEESLCITPGEKVWIVNVDICPINYDGNLIDIGTFAAIAALRTATLPKLEKDGTVNYNEKTKEKLKLGDEPLAVTVGKIGDTFIIDPLADEEEVLDARLTVTTLEDGTICAIQKGGDAPLTLEDIKRMVELAKKKSKELRKKLPR